MNVSIPSMGGVDAFLASIFQIFPIFPIEIRWSVLIHFFLCIFQKEKKKKKKRMGSNLRNVFRNSGAKLIHARNYNIIYTTSVES